MGEGPGWRVMRDAQNKEWQQQQQQKKYKDEEEEARLQEPTIIEQTRATSSEESNECERMIEELSTRERSHEGKSERRRTRLRGVYVFSLRFISIPRTLASSVFGGVFVRFSAPSPVIRR